MNSPNEKDLIYYGTDMKYIESLDQVGLDKPRFRQEQFISVSISGYRGLISCEHPELKGMAHVFSQWLKVAEVEDGYLKYHNGYTNSLTCFQGFGPCPNPYVHTFDGLKENRRDSHKVTAVLSAAASKYLVEPSKEREFEYLSLALHSFVSKIREEDIMGWIVEDSIYDETINQMEMGKLKQRQVWKVSGFPKLEFDLANKEAYKIILC